MVKLASSFYDPSKKFGSKKGRRSNWFFKSPGNFCNALSYEKKNTNKFIDAKNKENEQICNVKWVRQWVPKALTKQGFATRLCLRKPRRRSTLSRIFDGGFEWHSSSALTTLWRTSLPRRENLLRENPTTSFGASARRRRRRRTRASGRKEKKKK